MSDVIIQSPLFGVQGVGQDVLAVDGKSCVVREIPFVEMINLRGNAADAQFAQAVHNVTNLALPTAANTYTHNATRQLIWLGPDEWLLKLTDRLGLAVEADLRNALQGQHVSVVQVGDGSTTLAIQGDGAANLIARGCPLDLHASVFGAGQSAQTHVAKASTVMLCLQPGQHYELTVRRSFAHYLYHWLCASAG